MNGVDKLEQRLAADPTSKVFVPLAEEYRKAGHLDRALAVLKAGLVRNPGYASARVALARVHLQRGELVEARELLTRLVAESPDNLLAVRLLEETGPPATVEPETAATPATGDLPGTTLPPAPAPASIDPSEVLSAPVQAPPSAPQPQPEPEPVVPAVAGVPPAVEAPASWATQRLSRDEVLARLSSATAHDALSDHEPAARQPEPVLAEAAPAPFEPLSFEPPVPEPPSSEPPVPELPSPETSSPEPAAFEPLAFDDAQSDNDWRHGFEALTDGERDRPLTVELAGLGAQSPAEPAPEPAPEPPSAPAIETAPETTGFAPAAAAVEAEDEAEPVRRSDPPAPAVVRTLTLARLYRRQGHFDRAARVYRDLLDLDPAHAEARRELGELCGEGLADITDDDVVPREDAPATALPRAHAETMAAVRLRKIEYLRTWLDQMRSEG